MREAPRQPKNLDPIDEEALAVMGHRIERWDLLLDESVPFDERRSRLLKDLNQEIAMLAERAEEEDEGSYDIEADELIDDIRMLSGLSDDRAAIEAFYRDRSEYYREARQSYIQSIQTA